MHYKLTPLDKQTLVITGATSGIGLATAEEAAARGAKVVINARDEDALNKVARRLEKDHDATVLAVPGDVGKVRDVEAIAHRAVAECGGFDTWINNAGVSIYGRLDEVPLEDHRRLFETNFWGVVRGSLAAVEHFKARTEEVGDNHAGVGFAIINLGSVVSDMAIPLQGMYSASKHAVKGFTNALRQELTHAKLPISVTLIKPAAIDTNYLAHAKNHMEDAEPSFPPPVYTPQLVAEAILYAAEHKKRSVTVGGGGVQMSLIGRVLPGLADKLGAGYVYRAQQGDKKHGRRGADSLDTPSGPEGKRGGQYDGRVRETSVATAAQLHPKITAAVTAGAVTAAAVAAGLAVFAAGRKGDDGAPVPAPEPRVDRPHPAEADSRSVRGVPPTEVAPDTPVDTPVEPVHNGRVPADG